MLNQPKLAVLILAAGQSKRLGQAKQLIEYKGKSLIFRQAELALSISPTVYCVFGCQYEKIQARVANLPIKSVYHDNWQQGLGSSIAKGVQALTDDIDAVLLLLVDQWRLNTIDLQTLITTWQRKPQHIVISANATTNTLSPPVIFPKSFFTPLMQLSGDDGAKQVLKKYQYEVNKVTIENAFFDLDTPEQLEQLAKL